MTTASDFQTKVTKFETDMDRVDLIVNGDATTTVAIDGGDHVPTIRKLQSDIVAGVNAEVSDHLDDVTAAAVGTVNSAGSAQVAAVGAAGATQVAAVGTAAAAVTSIAPGLVGGRRNLIPDPFFKQAVSNKYTKSPTKRTIMKVGFYGSIDTPRASSPFPDGKQVTFGGTSQDGFEIALTNLGLKATDTFKIGVQLARSSGSQTSGAVMTYYFLDTALAVISSGTLITASSGTPWDSASRPFISGTLTVPAGASEIGINFPNIGAPTIYVDAIWMHAVDVPATPSDIEAVPALGDRLAHIEAQAHERNNTFVRTVQWDSASVALAASSGTTQFVNNRPGYAQACLTSGFPTGGANAVRVALDWDVGSNAATSTPLVYVHAELRTRPITSTPGHPSSGRAVARGYITVDPNLGTAGLATIAFHDLVTGAFKTVVPADLDATYCVCVWALAANGDLVTQLHIPLGTNSNKYTAFPLGFTLGSEAGDHLQWGDASIGTEVGMDLMLLTNPRDLWRPSTSFASAVIAAADDLPDLSALPKKVYGVVGREALMFWDNVELRPSKDTHMLVSGMPLTSVRRDGIRYTPSGTGSRTATIVPYRGGVASSTKTVQFQAVAASAASGTKAVLMFGDSLVRNGSVIDELAAIDATDSVTNLSFIGTQLTGSGKYMVGADGTSLGSYFGATLNGGVTNPFYDSAGTHSFSFAHFLANSTVSAQLDAVSTGKTEPDYVFIEAGQNETGSALTDASALALAGGWASNAEAIVQNILAATTNTKVVIYTATPGPIEQEGASTEYPAGYSAVWRQRRNWIILAAQQIASFSGRESSRIYVTPCGSAIDPVMGWDNKSFLPRTQTLVRNSPADFATYAALAASLAYAAGTIAKATDTNWYYIKMGPSGSGHWRPATEEDGFEWVENDTIHYGAYGAHCVAEAHWALIKNVG